MRAFLLLCEMKVTKQIRKEISELAAKLLPSYYDVQVSFIGAKLIDKGIKQDAEGNEIEPNKIYSFTKPCLVNHKRRLCDMYKKHGKLGLVEYVKAQAEIHKARNPIDLHSNLI